MHAPAFGPPLVTEADSPGERAPDGVIVSVFKEVDRPRLGTLTVTLVSGWLPEFLSVMLKDEPLEPLVCTSVACITDICVLLLA